MAVAVAVAVAVVVAVAVAVAAAAAGGGGGNGGGISAVGVVVAAVAAVAVHSRTDQANVALRHHGYRSQDNLHISLNGQNIAFNGITVSLLRLTV